MVKYTTIHLNNYTLNQYKNSGHVQSTPERFTIALWKSFCGLESALRWCWNCSNLLVL